jgi:hypothetical protein
MPSKRSFERTLIRERTQAAVDASGDAPNGSAAKRNLAIISAKAVPPGGSKAADEAYWRIGAGRLAAQSTTPYRNPRYNHASTLPGKRPSGRRASGKGILKVARELGTGSSVVQRIKAEAAASG